MPDRFLNPSKHPRFTAYFILFLALVVLGQQIWIYNLNGRVGAGEAIRRSDAKNAKARAASDAKNTKARALQGCRYLDSLIDTSINIPVMNLDDILAGPLTAAERVKRQRARDRYLRRLDELKPAITQCIPILEEAAGK